MGDTLKKKKHKKILKHNIIDFQNNPKFYFDHKSLRNTYTN